MKQIFISYSRKDTEFTRRLTDMFSLIQMETWVDWQDIPPSVDWMLEIYKGIEEADIFVFVLSPDSIISEVCRQEIQHAVKNHKRIIPVIARDIEADAVFPELKHLNWITFTQERFEKCFEKLLSAIRTDYEWVQTHRRLQNKALEWKKCGFETSYLLRGRDLEEAEAQLLVNENKEPHPTELLKEYVATSREAERIEIQHQREKDQQIEFEKRAKKRQRRLTAILLAIFTAVFMVTYYWFYKYATTKALELITEETVGILRMATAQINVDEFVALYTEGVPNAAGEAWLAVWNALENDDPEYETLLAYAQENYGEGTSTGFSDDPRYRDDLKFLASYQTINPNISLFTFTRGTSQNEIVFVADVLALTEPTIATPFLSHRESKYLILGLEEVVLRTEDGTCPYGTNGCTGEPYVDEWGTWLSAFAPIRNSTGEVVGGMGADVNADYISQVQYEIRSNSIKYFLITYAIMLALVYLSSESFIRLFSRRKQKRGG